MKTRSYKEVVDFVISHILMASSNVRSVSLITPRGTLRQFRMREDVNLLLNTKEMADLVKSVDVAASSKSLKDIFGMVWYCHPILAIIEGSETI